MDRFWCYTQINNTMTVGDNNLCMLTIITGALHLFYLHTVDVHTRMPIFITIIHSLAKKNTSKWKHRQSIKGSNITQELPPTELRPASKPIAEAVNRVIRRTTTSIESGSINDLVLDIQYARVLVRLKGKPLEFRQRFCLPVQSDKRHRITWENCCKLLQL